MYGVDASPEMLARANKKARKAGVEIVLKNALVEALPFPDGQFDVVLSTVTLAAHRRLDGALFEYLVEVVAGVLAAAIAVKDQPGFSIWTAPESSHLQGVDDQVTPHIRLHRPTHHTATEQIDDHGQKQPTFFGVDTVQAYDPLSDTLLDPLRDMFTRGFLPIICVLCSSRPDSRDMQKREAAGTGRTISFGRCLAKRTNQRNRTNRQNVRCGKLACCHAPKSTPCYSLFYS